MQRAESGRIPQAALRRHPAKQRVERHCSGQPVQLDGLLRLPVRRGHARDAHVQPVPALDAAERDPGAEQPAGGRLPHKPTQHKLPMVSNGPERELNTPRHTYRHIY